ncbi:CRISPR-associated protein Cas2 [Desulfofarcimen acetoxidans DSM 771]|uniref:CRISPR-associated endoribonuclease Cas2 n=1 Tax=Desulfofarcimen acetoxidans (strain ATCC 49208 / DSM 771 / KCTC 5769 / VKM B-1644 / 5575) TaxID=485916 RepID=C8W347_DESAS|nr:CRISPR-associated endonuclease Cas2 [Desulfofarcimen acetoxidans]ACV61814.1 CRISPR-associated protein Cas2 [Desulfofarcimen acetoxidans DSM 771]
MYIILVYDIEMDEGGAKASRRVFKTCKKYLTHIQKSVFEGDITPSLLQKLRIELDKFIRKDRDSVLVFKSREERWLQKEFWGKEDDKTSNFF